MALLLFIGGSWNGRIQDVPQKDVYQMRSRDAVSLDETLLSDLSDLSTQKIAIDVETYVWRWIYHVEGKRYGAYVLAKLGDDNGKIINTVFRSFEEQAKALDIIRNAIKKIAALLRSSQRPFWHIRSSERDSDEAEMAVLEIEELVK